MPSTILHNRRILAVDDEPDVLETLEDLLIDLPGLVLDTATDYDGGYQLLRSWTYDVVILDIMGVRGLDLLNAAVHLGFPAVMLSAHAVTPATLKSSIELGARAFIPKEKMADIVDFLEDVLTLSHARGLKRMFNRLGGYFSKRFGSQWQKKEADFWSEVTRGDYRPAILP